MINNFLCEYCDKNAVCKVMDMLHKFHEEARRPLGVNITMNSCANYGSDTPDGEADEV